MAELTNNQKIVLSCIRGYYSACGEVPDASEIATALKINVSVVEFLLPLLVKAGRLQVVNEKYVLTELPRQHRVHSDKLGKNTKAIIFT